MRFNELRFQVDKEGCAVIPFPQKIRHEMAEYVRERLSQTYPPSTTTRSIDERITETLCSIPDAPYSKSFLKPFRVFPNSFAENILSWFNQEMVSILGWKKAWSHSIRPSELRPDLGAHRNSYDCYWRCVRPFKNDTGYVHSDLHFWKLDESQNNLPFECKEGTRWKMWIPILGCTPQNSLQWIPGTHHENIPYEFTDTVNGKRPTISESWIQARTPEFFTPVNGSDCNAMFFHDGIAHRAMMNEGTIIRVSAEITLIQG